MVSSEIFAKLDDYLWRLTYQWALWQHRNKPKRWVTARYFGRFNPTRTDRWVFGDRHTGAYMRRFGWTKIVRHTMVAGTASVDDPALANYWALRRRRPRQLPLDTYLLNQQDRECPGCGEPLIDLDRPPQTPQEWEQWHRNVRVRTGRYPIQAVAPGQPDQIRRTITHLRCRPQPRSGTTPMHPAPPTGLA